MQTFRQFEAHDPFGRKFQVFFKWLQTAISIRHSDTVDVKFILKDESGGPQTEKTIALPHADLLRLSKETGHALEDPWCARLAASHLVHLIATGEDMEKDLVTVTPPDLRRHADDLARAEKATVSG